LVYPLIVGGMWMMTSILQPETRPVGSEKPVLIIGLIQIGLVLGLLSLPVFGTCIPEVSCSYQNYIQTGGDILGYSFLAALMVLGGLMIRASQVSDVRRVRNLLLTNALVCLALGIAGARSFGPVFVPVAMMCVVTRRSLDSKMQRED